LLTVNLLISISTVKLLLYRKMVTLETIPEDLQIHLLNFIDITTVEGKLSRLNQFWRALINNPKTCNRRTVLDLQVYNRVNNYNIDVSTLIDICKKYTKITKVKAEDPIVVNPYFIVTLLNTQDNIKELYLPAQRIDKYLLSALVKRWENIEVLSFTECNLQHTSIEPMYRFRSLKKLYFHGCYYFRNNYNNTVTYLSLENLIIIAKNNPNLEEITLPDEILKELTSTTKESFTNLLYEFISIIKNKCPLVKEIRVHFDDSSAEEEVLMLNMIIVDIHSRGINVQDYGYGGSTNNNIVFTL
jgi:hypothetical protein